MNDEVMDESVGDLGTRKSGMKQDHPWPVVVPNHTLGLHFYYEVGLETDNCTEYRAV
jgi:hypothetical protein